MISDPKFNTAREWFEKLRVNLIDIIQTIDENNFEIIPWDHKRVVVTNSTGILAPFLVETVLGAMLILNGNFIKYAEQQKNHVWLPHHFTPLCEKVLLVIGLGTIGSLIAQKAQSLGMRVIGTRRHPAPNPFVDEVYADNELPKLIGQADFVSLHVRMSEKNMNLINKNILSAMKIGSFLINTARGSVVDENALLDSLNNGPLAGAYLDVFENEPLPKDNDLWNHPNVIITPHAADNIKDWPVRFADFFMDNLLRWNNNDNLLNEITP